MVLDNLNRKFGREFTYLYVVSLEATLKYGKETYFVSIILPLNFDYEYILFYHNTIFLKESFNQLYSLFLYYLTHIYSTHCSF